MKSYINRLMDYREAPFEREITITCSREYIDSQMRHITRAYKKKEIPERLEKGDVAVLSLESGLKKFNRPSVYVTVGGGLFSQELEEQLKGHLVGDTFEAFAEGGSVMVTIKQAERTIFPEPTDEMAAAYAKEHPDYEECTTVEAYRQYVIKNYLEKERQSVFYDTLNSIVDYVLTHSDWEFDPEELKELVEKFMEEIRQELQEEGQDPDHLSAEELAGFFGVDSREELERMMEIEAERQIASDLWMAQIRGIDAKTASREELERYDWEFLELYLKENLKIKEEI